MENIDYLGIKEIVELHHSYDVNTYLKLGWKLLHINNSDDRAPYVLGWEGDNPIHPELPPGLHRQA